MRFEVKLRNISASADDLLADLRSVADALKTDTLTYAAYKKAGRFSPGTIERRFGSWQEGLRLVGLKSHHRKVDTQEELFENLALVWEKLGHQPSRSELRAPLSQWSGSTYENQFRGWNAALIAFAEWAEATDQELPPSESSQERTRRTKRQPDLRLRFNVLRRDRFTCKCGRSPALDPSCVLHVDHVVAWSKGGETTLENLQTLCDRCNLGKGNQ